MAGKERPVWWWPFTLTENDRKFLRSLKIDPEVTEPRSERDTDEDDPKDKRRGNN